ncbi:MAG: DUF2058 family protein [Lysobacteraceae bacterium]|nr:MAG: DUF2058 family protein [Xanthomonadaceae bacterium]
MSESLRDQLLGLGFKPAPKPEKNDKPKPAQSARPQATHKAKPQHSKPQVSARAPSAHKPKTREEIDLAKAYAIRAQREKEERIEAERLKQEEARKRREAKAKLAELLKDKALNDPNAEIARHFSYGNKIKRVYVNETQLKALNAGELGVVQLEGRYLLVTAETLAEAEAVFAPAIALKVDPNAPAEDDPYADPKYQVPDDLVW